MNVLRTARVIALCGIAFSTKSLTAQVTSVSSFFAVDPRASYLRNAPGDNPSAPTVLDVGSALGRLITLQATGPWCVTICGTVQPAGLWMVFSSSSVLLPLGGVLNRVQGAIDIGLPYTSTAVAAPYNGNPMDIAEDFFVGATAITINVPTAARYLFIGVPDSFVADNDSPDAAHFGVIASEITTTPEPSSVALLTAGLAAIGIIMRRRRAKQLTTNSNR